MAQQYTKYHVGDTIQFLNANDGSHKLGKIVEIERNPQNRPTNYIITFTHTKVYPQNRTRNRFPITDINKQTKLVTELPAGADCPAAGPSRRIGGNSLRKMKKRKLRKTRKNKRKRRI